MELMCPTKDYPWGKKGRNSLIGQLLAGQKDRITDEEHYAELWMGVHRNGESVICETGEPLRTYVLDHPDVMGTARHVRDDHEFPFLMKVLSIEEALSIQAHPDKSLAVSLNRSDPNNYPDSNHKPELAIALTSFEALIGFRPYNEIKDNLQKLPEISGLVSSKSLHEFSSNGRPVTLKAVFSELMSAPQENVEISLSRLHHRLSSAVPQVQRELFFPLLDTLFKRYPGDVGNFCIYLFNHIVLKPNEAVFVHAGLPHAYLSGDIIECMASSDNVIRAGLTNKFRDVKTLCGMLDYRGYSISEIIFSPTHLDKFTTLYKVPVPDFVVQRIEISSNVKYKLRKHPSCSIVITISGAGSATSEGKRISFRPGLIYFIPANHEVEVEMATPLVIFQCYANA